MAPTVCHSAISGAGDLYLAAMDAIYPVNQGVLFFIEGLGQSGLANNWGDGVCTDSATIAQYGISDPNPFFTTLMSKDYLNQVNCVPQNNRVALSGQQGLPSNITPLCCKQDYLSRTSLPDLMTCAPLLVQILQQRSSSKSAYAKPPCNQAGSS